MSKIKRRITSIACLKNSDKVIKQLIIQNRLKYKQLHDSNFLRDGIQFFIVNVQAKKHLPV